MDGFSLLKFWAQRNKVGTCAKTGETTRERSAPYLALIARLYRGIESTSCQLERSFPALFHLGCPLNSTMTLDKVERMMFLRLNILFIPKVRALNKATAEEKAAITKCADNFYRLQVAAESTYMELIL